MPVVQAWRGRPPSADYEREERAAIYEYEAGLTRETAETLAGVR